MKQKFIWLGIFLLNFSSFSKPLDTCPKLSMEACAASLPDAVDNITNCKPDEPGVKTCALMFVKMLSRVDDQAPFFEGIYKDGDELKNADLEKMDVRDYTISLTALKKASPNQVLALYDLAKVIILQYAILEDLNPAERRQLHNMIDVDFKNVEGEEFQYSDPQMQQAYIDRKKEIAKFIDWPLNAYTNEVIES